MGQSRVERSETYRSAVVAAPPLTDCNTCRALSCFNHIQTIKMIQYTHTHVICIYIYIHIILYIKIKIIKHLNTS